MLDVDDFDGVVAQGCHKELAALAIDRHVIDPPLHHLAAGCWMCSREESTENR